jgi:bifunctional enzyme CysN/CysC
MGGPHSASPLRLLTCGSLGDGKSTLIRRLLSEQDLVVENHVAHPLEHAQGVAIDVAHRCFSTERRAFVIADAPGNEQDIRAMANAAVNSDVAILLVDAHRGILDQTLRHGMIASVLGIRHMLLAVNKMDLAEFEERVFERIAATFTRFARELGLQTVQIIPIAAREGDNVCARSERMRWYAGPSLLSYLEGLDVDDDANSKPFRMPVQSADRCGSDFRRLTGTIASGSARVRDELAVLPSGETTRIQTLACGGVAVDSAQAGNAVVVTLADDIDASPGDMLVAPRARPQLANQFAAHLVWTSRDRLLPGRSYLIKINCNTLPATVTELKYLLDMNTLARIAAKTLALNEVGVCNLAVARPIPFDSCAENRATGAFILLDRYSNETVAVGIIDFALRRATNIHHQQIVISKAARSELKKHQPAVLWFTGLSGAGKSTLANCVEAGLHARGAHTLILDGDNVRHALSKDLGFTEADRVENIRRIGEVAKLMTEAGLIVLCAFISPFRAERRMVRELLPAGEFIEIFVDTPIEECIARDAKGLYRRAFAGEIKNFTGVDQPYEVPENADLHLQAHRQAPDALAERVIQHLLRRKILD